MKKIITLILIAVAFAMANTSFSVKGDVSILSEDAQILNLKLGTDFSGLLYEPVTESEFLLYAKYGYNNGFYKGHEFGFGIGYGCELFGVQTNLIGIELGRNSQGDMYYQFEMGYMPVNSINFSVVLRYDDSVDPDNIMDHTVRFGVNVGFAFGKTTHVKTSFEENEERRACEYAALYASTTYKATADTVNDSVYVPKYYNTAVNYSGSYTYVRGHLRTSKSGKVSYVRPYYRRK